MLNNDSYEEVAISEAPEKRFTETTDRVSKRNTVFEDMIVQRKAAKVRRLVDYLIYLMLFFLIK